METTKAYLLICHHRVVVEVRRDFINRSFPSSSCFIILWSSDGNIHYYHRTPGKSFNGDDSLVTDVSRFQTVRLMCINKSRKCRGRTFLKYVYTFSTLYVTRCSIVVAYKVHTQNCDVRFVREDRPKSRQRTEPTIQ